MYTGNIKFLLAAYKNHFAEVATLERFKWQNIKIFQENWDIEDTDFAGMMGRSLPTGKIRNVLDSGAFYSPLANMKKMAQLDPDRVQTLFKNLLTDDYDFETDRARFHAKLTEFETGANNLYRELHLPGSNSHNDDRAAMLYLTCKFPDRFCLYKPADFETLYPLAGLNLLTANSTKFEKLIMYLILWQCIRYEISRDPELQQMVRALDAEDEYGDPNLTLLAQDILHTVSTGVVMADILDRLQTDGLVNHLKPSTGTLPTISILPTAHSGHSNLAHYVPVKLVCDLEQRRVDQAGLHKTVDAYSIFHGPGRGFDVLSYDASGQEKYILVKVTKAENPQTIELSSEEANRLSQSQGRCQLYVIYQYDEDTTEGQYLVTQL
jgi:hypothetical protein